MERAHTTPRVRFAYKRLVQLCSGAAALASVVGLFLTLGDRAQSMLGGGVVDNGVQLQKATLTPMTLTTYLKTRQNESNVTRLGYSRKDLAAKVLAVDFDARFTGWTKGANFPVKVTLESRDAAGHSHFAEHDIVETLDAATDFCGCHAFFFPPKSAVADRISVEVFRPGAPNAEPLRSIESAWYRP
jgi:hypothetical protein